MLLERVADERLCRMLIEHWRARDKIVNSIDATGGNVVRADIKRRQDVQVDDRRSANAALEQRVDGLGRTV